MEKILEKVKQNIYGGVRNSINKYRDNNYFNLFLVLVSFGTQYLMTHLINYWLTILLSLMFVQTTKISNLNDNEINRNVVVWSCISVVLTFCTFLVGNTGYFIFIMIYKMFCVKQLGLESKIL